jgi:gluconate:H+ symporter, GntP family
MLDRPVARRTIVIGSLMIGLIAAMGSHQALTPPGRAPQDSAGTSGGVPERESVPTKGGRQETVAETEPDRPQLARPLLILAVGIAVVLGLIIGWKANAFLALITAAILVSLLAEGPLAVKMTRVATAFGESAGKIGIVIALAAVIGKCMLDSGAADRIVRAFLRLFGRPLAPVALMGSGFVLAIPVFFDTVFYLLVPLARSLFRTTKTHFLLYVLAIGGGGAITHTLVPPTPGPLVMAAQLEFDVGVMIMVGILVSLPAACAALVFATWIDRRMPIPMRPVGTEPEPEPLDDAQLPSLGVSLAPVVLPVVLISANTILKQWAQDVPPHSGLGLVYAWSEVFGNANFALLISALIALVTLVVQRGLSRVELARSVETALMSGGVIILITAAGGAFGEMLKAAQVGLAIEAVFSGFGAAGLTLLVLGFSVAAVLKIAQGSSTVAMITGSSMLAGIATSSSLPFHPVYLATAIGTGSLVGSWMNDSGFWIFAKMSGLTEVEALKSWTIMLLVLAFTGLLATLVLAAVMPYPPFTSPPGQLS